MSKELKLIALLLMILISSIRSHGASYLMEVVNSELKKTTCWFYTNKSNLIVILSYSDQDKTGKHLI